MPAKGRKAMSTSIFLARIIGPVLLAIGLGLLVNRAMFQRLAKEFLDSPALVFMSGLIAMPVGIAIILVHNVWVADWPVMITIFGWLSAIGGFARIVAPQLVTAIGQRAYARDWPAIGGAALMLAVGIVLTFVNRI
jgi:hypothetical protein